jgi:hypothetical protein
MMRDMRDVLDIVRAKGSLLHESTPDRPQAATAENPSISVQIKKADAVLASIQGRLAADLRLAVAAQDRSAAGQSGLTESLLEPNAAFAAAAQYPAAINALQSAQEAKVAAKSQRLTRHRTGSLTIRDQRAAAQAMSNLTQPPTSLKNVHGVYYGQELPEQAIGVARTGPPGSTGKPKRTTATVLAVRTAELPEGGETFTTMPPTPTTMAIRQGRAETPTTIQGSRCITPNSHSAAVWDSDSVVLVAGCRPPPPISSTGSVQYSSGLSTSRAARGQPKHVQSNPQMVLFNSWAVALAAAVDNDQESTAPRLGPGSAW